MVRLLKGTLTLCLISGLASIAWGQAQDRQQPKGPSIESAVLGPLLSQPGVQKELKLTDEQLDKLKDTLKKVAEKYKDDFAKFQKMSPEEQQKTMMAMYGDSNKAIAGALDAKQWKRFKQIQWQINGVGALQDPDLQKELKLSDEQKKKLDGVFNDAAKKMQEMMKAQESSPEKYQALFKDVEKKANDVLNEEQQKNLKELKGPPFQLAQPSPQPPRAK
jgi:DNA anti-recombination protein RmuC